MKIKHFAGYGSVNAKKISSTTASGIKTLVIEVTENHKWGLERDDKYDLFNWLVKKFDKSVPDYRSIQKVTYQDDYVKQGQLDVERCVYTFKIAA